MTKKSNKRNKFWRPKGRALDVQAQAQVAQLLKGKPNRPDLLIEYLHLIQDNFACLYKKHLHALAGWLNISMVEVYEVATFYHHFEVLEDDAPTPEQVTVRVCDSVSCMLAGAPDLIKALEAENLNGVRIQKVPCVGRCEKAPVAVVGQNPVELASLQKVAQAVTTGDITCKDINVSLEAYERQGGYQLYRDCLADKHSPESIIKTLEQAQLRGLGGAGFPAGRKWNIVRNQPAPRWIAVNIDEGEPGTFKDRVVLETKIHDLLEGLLIAAWVIDSTQCVIYIRDEYPAVRHALQLAVTQLSDNTEFKLPNIQIRRGAGAYICGEESAMLESIEGKRGLPRQRPPFIAEVGLFGFPTLEHNAETLVWVPEILNKGADWYLSHARNGRSGLRRYSLSGRVNKPGVYLADAGITLNELIEEFGGGMLEGHALYGYLPGGASGGILPASLADEPLDFDTLQKHGCFIGSAAVIVFSDQDRARDVALNAMQFFAHESCGQCTPCRVGTVQAAELMQAPVWDQMRLEGLAQVMEDASICGLGQAAPNPMRCVMKYFTHEVV
ncbi:MAG: NAD(P)H-dependent oxidoreductase subunit E [Arenicellales bacterium]